MPTRVTTEFRVNERGIQRLLTTDIKDFVDELSRDSYRAARQIVPIGSGRLAAGIRQEAARRSGVYEMTGAISATAPYVGHVIYGTGGESAIHGAGRGRVYPIGAAMVRRGVPFGNVNKRPGQVGRQPHRKFSNKFRGQDPNNFLARAVDLAAARHGIVVDSSTIPV